MKLGFLTACMPDRPLEEIAGWAGANGYEALELAAWPQLGDRPFTAGHVAADRFDDAEADRVRGALETNGLTLSALAYYDNNLHPDPAERDGIHAHVRACIDAAAALGAPPVGTFIGRDPGRSVAENLREAEPELWEWMFDLGFALNFDPSQLYRIPGLGEVDFRRYVDTLYEGGFDGVLSVEHEDPVWGGTPEKVEQGLQVAQRNLRPLVVGA